MENKISTLPRTSGWSFFVLAAAAILIALTYYNTFLGSQKLRTELNAVAFADASHYVQLLDNGHYMDCFKEKPAGVHREHRRKSVHHIGYLFVASAIIQSAKATGLFDGGGAMWLVSPALGCINFLLAFWLFHAILPRKDFAWPGALMYALVPGTWTYASMPESWVLSGTAVLFVLYARERQISRLMLGILIGTFMLSNFLLLLLPALTYIRRESLKARVLDIVVVTLSALACWITLLLLLGLTLSPDFFPHRFFQLTVDFKNIFPENLKIYNPMRWLYNGTNLLVLPMILNQGHLNFGRWALMDTALKFPLGTLAVIGVAALWAMAITRTAGLAMRTPQNTDAFFLGKIPGEWFYLLLVFAAAGMALYYESFIYSSMVCPVFFTLTLRDLPRSDWTRKGLWVLTLLWALNAAQQMVTFRRGIGF